MINVPFRLVPKKYFRTGKFIFKGGRQLTSTVKGFILNSCRIIWDCDYYSEVRVIFEENSGQTRTSFSVGSKDECCYNCRENYAQCDAYTFEISSSICTLYQVGDENVLENIGLEFDVPGYISGYLQCGMYFFIWY